MFRGNQVKNAQIVTNVCFFWEDNRESCFHIKKSTIKYWKSKANYYFGNFFNENELLLESLWKR